MLELSEVEFYPEEEVFVSSIDDLKKHSSIFSGFEAETVEGDKISITEEGRVKISASETLALTRSCLKQLCKGLRIPDPFAQRIPFELLRDNITQLLERQEAMRVYRSGSNGHLVNIRVFRPGRTVVPTVDLVEAIFETLVGVDDVRFHLRESHVTTSFSLPELPVVEVKVGDITKFGWQIRSSECDFLSLAGSLHAFRLVCSNGMVAPRRFGGCRATSRGKAEQIIKKFVNGLSRQDRPAQVFIEEYRRVASGTELIPTNPQVIRLWTGIKKIVGDMAVADSVLSIDEETRKTIRAVARAERLALTRVDLDTKDDVGEEDFRPVLKRNWWDTINQITESANEFGGETRRRLQVLGGKAVHLAANIFPN